MGGAPGTKGGPGLSVPTEAAWEGPGGTVFWKGATALRALNSGRNFALRQGREVRSEIRTLEEETGAFSLQTDNGTDTHSQPAAERVREGKAVRPGQPCLPWRSERPLNADPPPSPLLLTVGL